MLAGLSAPHLERYLLRGRFDVEQTYQCAVSRRTSTRGARDDELGVPENEGRGPGKNATRTLDPNLRGIPRFGAFRPRWNTLARELGGRAMLVRQAGSQRKGQP